MIRIFFVLFTGILFISCTAAEKNLSSKITFEEIKSRVNENSGKLKSLDADGEISIDSPEMSNSGSITVSINKPDSIFTKLEGPFGIDVADLLITRNNFIYYKPMDNTVIRGPSNSHYLGIIMNIKIEFEDIVNAFSGKFIFKDDLYANADISIDKNNYVITIKSDNEIKKYWIDSDNYYVIKAATFDINGNTNIEILYENFYEKDGIHFPKKISITRPKEKQYIWLNYSKEEFNNDKLSFKLRIPKSAKQINWDGN